MIADQTRLRHELARWKTRTFKAKALVGGRLKALKAKINPEISILLPLAAHRHFWSGFHNDTESMAFLAERVPEDGIIFDIGSNIGVYLAALYAWKRRRVTLVGFEPIPTTLAVLQETLALNAVPARIEPIAVSSREGEVRLSAYASGLNNFWLPNDDGRHPSISVRSQSLDRWVAEHPELEPDAIKIDVEGHELEVLEGAAGLLNRKRPALMVECHGASWDDLRVPRARFAELLAAAGYRNLRFSSGQAVDFQSLKTTVHLFAT